MYIHWPADPKIENMMTPGKMFDRPRITAASAPPVIPPEIVLAFTRSHDDGGDCGVVSAPNVAVRMAKKDVPRAKVCSPDAPAKRNGTAPVLDEPPNFKMPTAPPMRKPAVPELYLLAG